MIVKTKQPSPTCRALKEKETKAYDLKYNGRPGEENATHDNKGTQQLRGRGLWPVATTFWLTLEDNVRFMKKTKCLAYQVQFH